MLENDILDINLTKSNIEDIINNFTDQESDIYNGFSFEYSMEMRLNNELKNRTISAINNTVVYSKEIDLDNNKSFRTVSNEAEKGFRKGSNSRNNDMNIVENQSSSVNLINTNEEEKRIKQEEEMVRIIKKDEERIQLINKETIIKQLDEEAKLKEIAEEVRLKMIEEKSLVARFGVR